MNPLYITAVGALSLGFLCGRVYTFWRMRQVQDMLVTLCDRQCTNVQLAAAADRDRSVVELMAQLHIAGAVAESPDDDEPTSH